jgi:predicted MFS family arabinose efflux permease
MQRLQSASWYPWLVAVLCMLLVATSNGMINAGITVFDEALLDEFGWTLSQLKTRDSITFLGASLLVLVAGWAVDRWGFKPLLLLGMALLALAYWGYGYASRLGDLYLLHGIFALVAASAGNMTNIVAAATWMSHRRGLAVGMTIAGTSLGGMLLPPVANALNASLGWRAALRAEALLPAVMFLLVLVLLGNRHQGSPARAGGEDESAGFSFGEALRRSQFHLIACAGAFTYFAILALFAHLFLYMRSLDYAPAAASYALSTLALAGLCGKLASGWIADRVDPFRFFKVQMLLMLTGLVGVSEFPSLVFPCLLLTGLGWGGLHTLYNFMLLHLFGLRDAGKINGAVSVFEAAGGAAGIYATGLAHDAWGGYGAAWLMVVAVMAVGTVLALLLRPPGNPG